MYQLNNLTPLKKKRKRVGRGGSRGGTSGKGHKGQKARSGPSISSLFEGGQMPLHRRLPKRGFTNARHMKDVEVINLKRLDEVFGENEVITRQVLIEKGLIKRKKSKKAYTVKILGDGLLTKKLIIHADTFSKSALEAIQESGGQAKVVEQENE